MARIIILLLTVLLFNLPLKANTDSLSLSTLVTVQNVPFEYCTKIFNTDADSLFYLTIAGINANRFRIDEIIGKTIIIHSSTDDFTSQPSGNSGSKIACGEIKLY